MTDKDTSLISWSATESMPEALSRFLMSSWFPMNVSASFANFCVDTTVHCPVSFDVLIVPSISRSFLVKIFVMEILSALFLRFCLVVHFRDTCRIRIYQ